MIAAKSTAKTAGKSAPRVPNVNSSSAVQLQLHLIVVELRCALSTITFAAHALYKQNADIDADVALTLQRSAAGPVHAGLERIEAVLAALDGSGGGEAAGLEGAH